MVQLFYKFKNANSQSSDFKYYNVFLDNKRNTQGLAIFKAYLLSLKAKDSQVTLTDLKQTQFIKVSHNPKTNTATDTLAICLQGSINFKNSNWFWIYKCLLLINEASSSN